MLGRGDEPLPVEDITQTEHNIIVWMDHRATEQAEHINETQHPVLKYVGGKMLPEIENLKILCLKESRREIYNSAWQFLGLDGRLSHLASAR